MRITRVYIDQEISNGQSLTLSDNAHRHLTQVLRLKTGDPCTIFNGNGYDYSAIISSCDKRHTEVQITDISDREPPPDMELHLAVGISRGERMDYVVQKSVELGVHSITPLFTERTNVKLKDKRLDKRMEHWQGVIISACEQSGRSYVPTLNPAQTLDAWLESKPTNGLLLDHRSEQTLSSLKKPNKQLSLLVGPEGGLSEKERSKAAMVNFQGIRLGPRVMRTETAPLAALAAIQTIWGDFN